MKKILFLNTTSYYHGHLCAEMEMMKSLMAEGNDVYSLVCRGQLGGSCISNPDGFYHVDYSEKCIECIYNYIFATTHFKFPEDKIIVLKNFPEYQFPVFEDICEVRDFSIHGVNLGFGALNSYVVFKRDIDDVQNHQEDLKIVLNAGYQILMNLEEIYEKIKFDEMYIFNGRFAENNVAVNFCKKHNIDYYLHERGGNEKKYALLKNEPFHSLRCFKKRMTEAWNNQEVPYEEKKLIAQNWFSDRLRGKRDPSGFYFDQEMIRLSLPEGFDKSKENIVFFISSRDEYILFDEYREPIAPDYIVIRLIAEHFLRDPSKHFYLRIHPHLKGLDNNQTREYEEMKNEGLSNLSIIPADSPIDSYCLAAHASKVITFGSTIGIESAFMGVPSILLGRGFYEDLGCVYLARNITDGYKLINSELSPLPEEKTYPYGYYCGTNGIEYKSFKTIDFTSGLIDGIDVKKRVSDIIQSMNV